MKIVFKQYKNRKLNGQWLEAEFMETSSIICAQVKAGGMYLKAAKHAAKMSAQHAGACPVSSFFQIFVDNVMVGYARLGVGVETFGNVLRDIYIRKSQRGNGYLRPIILQMEKEFEIVMAELGDLTVQNHYQFWVDLGYTERVGGNEGEFYAFKPEIVEKLIASNAYSTSNKLPIGYNA